MATYSSFEGSYLFPLPPYFLLPLSLSWLSLFIDRFQFTGVLKTNGTKEVVKWVQILQKWLIAYSDGDRSEHTFKPEKWRVYSNQSVRLMKTFQESLDKLNAQ
jgi:hypothetical protein